MKYIPEDEIYSLFSDNGIALLHVSDIDKLPRKEDDTSIKDLSKMLMDIVYNEDFHNNLIVKFTHDDGDIDKFVFLNVEGTYKSFVNSLGNKRELTPIELLSAIILVQKHMLNEVAVEYITF